MSKLIIYKSTMKYKVKTKRFDHSSKYQELVDEANKEIEKI